METSRELIADGAIEAALAGIQSELQAGQNAPGIGGVVALRSSLEQLLIVGDGFLTGGLRTFLILGGIRVRIFFRKFFPVFCRILCRCGDLAERPPGFISLCNGQPHIEEIRALGVLFLELKALLNNRAELVTASRAIHTRIPSMA